MPQLTPSNSKAFQSALASWYAEARRPLPWRVRPSLYGTVISECMLQQTQVKTVLPYFERWLKRFPNFEALAKAPAEDVLKHWEGLGYYSRARNLHRMAQNYVALERKPQTAEEWQLLPGIGTYTSAAISSIAQNYPAAVVDGNVVRILARLTRDERSFKNNGEAVKALTPLARELLDESNPGDHNQAMMELGATVCTKHNPLCTVCPVVKFCAAAKHGSPEKLPRIERRATEKVEIDRFWIVRDEQILLHQIPTDAAQLAGQSELPRAEHFKKAAPEKLRKIAVKTRSITHRRIRETIYQVDSTEITPAADLKETELQWIKINALDRITLSGPHRRWIKELLQTQRST